MVLLLLPSEPIVYWRQGLSEVCEWDITAVLLEMSKKMRIVQHSLRSNSEPDRGRMRL